jgi:hypothetical protein
MNPTDIADFLATHGQLDAALDAAPSMVPLAERMAPEVGKARAALAAALLALGATDTTKDERASVERALLAEVGALAWLHHLHTAEYERSLAGLAAAGGFTEATKRVRRAVTFAGDEIVSPVVVKEPTVGDMRREEALSRMVNLSAASSLRKLPGAHVPDGLVVPFGYEIDDKGVRTVTVDEVGNVKNTPVCARPILVTGRLVDPDGLAAELLVVRWHDGRAWQGRVVGRSQVCQARELAGLSAYGLPVGSASAALVSEWLETFTVHNLPKLPTAKAVTSMGWRNLDTPTPIFVLGPEVLRADGTSAPSQLDDSDPTTWPDNAVHLRAEDPATLHLTRAWRMGGTWEGWLEVAAKAAAHPALGLALQAAVAPMILRIVGAANFVLDIAGITSQGKSTALYFAASAMGFPDDKQQGIVRPWNSTRVGIERVSAFCADLPLLLDDTRQLNRKQVEDVSSVVYMVVNGQGRGRGTATGGVQTSASWHTVMLSTGETPITELAPAGGAAARTVSLFGSPLGGTDQEETARAIRDGSFTHYGHVGRRVAFWLMGKEGGEARTELVRRWYAEEVRRVSADGVREDVRAVLARAADYAAVLAVVGRVLVAVGVPAWRGVVTPRALAETAIAATAENADRPTEALGAVYAWCAERPEAFWGRHREDKNGRAELPSGGKWLGAWAEAAVWDRIAVNEAALKLLLRERGFDVEATLRTWLARGWVNGQDGRASRVVKVGETTLRCVVLQRQAVVVAGLAE